MIIFRSKKTFSVQVRHFDHNANIFVFLHALILCEYFMLNG